jgi:hypothetical protein
MIFTDQLRFPVLTGEIRNAQRGCRAGVYHAAHASFIRRLQDIARAFYRYCILPSGLVVPAHPGCRVKNHLDPLYGSLKRFRLGQVAQGVFNLQPFQQAQGAGGAVESAYLVAPDE